MTSLLSGYDLKPGARAGLMLAVRGADAYSPVLRRAFPSPSRWFGPYESFDRRFDYVLYVQQVDEKDLRSFLDFLSTTLLVPTALEETWAVSMHMADATTRTEVGELVHLGKTYASKAGDPASAKALADRLAERARLHPGIRRADRVVGIPADPPKTPHNLPELLASAVAGAAGSRCDPALVRKVHPTPQIKDLANEDKLAALDGAFEVTDRIDGESIVLVDDLLHPGTTLSCVGGLLREAGARQVTGLVATKTLRS